ncbi:hypothetical protein AUJ59_02260 [Candidatus Beckwithbacteria bacterium CG1_02_47_37]|uniref:Uncharacterized protein n=1 Tax=Candidatus Beckwithbacteria bacterium CG1_02_47_37 TaxID=1805034 RepID=A0A1J4RP81_9BACT|nr:MAG: hypothetical protein AUJ59_02260 [Candidatus Beckwithbacteria bacterium CG1_02_47_37]
MKMKSLLKKTGRIVLIFLVAALVFFAASAPAGALTTANGSQYNPIITIAYLLTACLFSYFYSATKREMFSWCLLALILSFLVNFIIGSLFLVMLPPALKKLRLI